MSTEAKETSLKVTEPEAPETIRLGGKAKETNKIYSTQNYSQFKLLERNRNLDERKVEQKMQELERHNLLEDFPIVVDKNLNVYDGQHRLEAASRLGIPVHYKISTSITEDDIAHINSISASWKLGDYLSYYIKKGNEDYRKVADFAEQNGILPYNAIGLLSGNSAQPGGQAIKAFERGEFHIENMDYAVQVMNMVEDFSKFFDFAKSKAFMNAISRLAKLRAYNHEEMLQKVEQRKEYLVRYNDVRSYINRLEEIYNYHRKGDYVSFKKA